MSVAFRFPRRPPAASLRLADEQELTYPEVGATANSELPSGYRTERASIDIGHGRVAFERGRAALVHWAAHRAIGATITPADAPLEVGVTVVVELVFGPLVITAPCRIVSTTNTTTAFGFAYGTLAGHPETGEESFLIHHTGDGAVTFEIVAFSRPASRFVRLGGPLSRQLQRRAMQGYLKGVHRYVTDLPPGR